MAGFECTYAKVAGGERLDLLAATRHDELCREDYQMIKKVGIKTVREGLAWHQIDGGGGKYDFRRFEKMMAIAREEGIQQIWDLNHFDYPDDVDPFSDEFFKRFEAYGVQCVRVLRKYTAGTIFIVPVNEISFFAWIGADQGSWAPYKRGRQNGFRFKKQLVRAALAAMAVIWREDKNVRFIHVDPLMRRLATQPANNTAKKHVTEFNDIVRFEAWDMLAGKVFPELGGNPKYLDMIGINYYLHNQEWVHSEGTKKISHQMMDWESSDRIPFGEMVREVYERYGRPMMVSETGSFGPNRAGWWQRTLEEIDSALKTRLPIHGVCAYPILDRPEAVGYLLPNSGIWDFEQDDSNCQRIPHEHSLEIIKSFIEKWQ